MNKLFFIASVLFAAQLYAAKLEDIDFIPLNQEGFEVEFKFEGEIPKYRVFALPSSNSILLDFDHTESMLSQRRFDIAHGVGRQLVVLPASNKLRIVVKTVVTTRYAVRQIENKLYLIVAKDTATIDQATKSTAVLSQIQSSENLIKQTEADDNTAAPIVQLSSTKDIQLSSFDFSRDEEGGSRLQFDFTNTEFLVETRKFSKHLELILPDTQVLEKLVKHFDVSSFTTLVQAIRIEQLKRSVRITIAVSEDYDVFSYQLGKKYIVAVQKAENTEKNIIAGSNDDNISISFQNIEVRSLLQLLAEHRGFNLIASDGITGNISLRLDNVPWDVALNIILESKGLAYRKNSNVLRIGTLEEMSAQDRLRLESQNAQEFVADLITEFIKVRYADAATISTLISSKPTQRVSAEKVNEKLRGQDLAGVQGLLSARGSVVVDERTNALIITDTKENLKQIITFIREIDIPVKQVMIEARIISASNDFTREFGTRWGFSNLKPVSDGYLSIGGSRNILSPGSITDDSGETTSNNTGASSNTRTVDLADTLMVDLPASGRSGAFSIGIINGNKLIDLELSALENEGFGEIISRPKIITGNNQRAVIRSGQQIPFQQNAGNGATSVSFKRAALELDVKPQITDDNNIIMDIKITQDSVGTIAPNGVPTINETQLHTKILIRNGETIILGGIFQHDRIKSENKVPFLGDIPLLGRLFRHSLTDNRKRELLIFITPKIIDS